MLVTVGAVRADRPARAGDRPGPADPLAPQARPVGPLPAARARRADRRRLRRARATRGSSRSSGSWSSPTRACSAPTVATALLFLAGITSYKRARRRFKYETWWSIHLYTYLALLLAFAAPGRQRRLVRRAAARDAVVDGALGRPARRGRLAGGSRCRSSARCGTASASPRSCGRAPTSSPSCSRAGASTGCRSPGGQFFQWRFLTQGRAGGRRTRSPSPTCRTATGCGSR